MFCDNDDDQAIVHDDDNNQAVLRQDLRCVGLCRSVATTGTGGGGQRGVSI